MPRYQATIRLFDAAGADRKQAQQRLEEQLRAAELGRWQVVAVNPEPPRLVVRARRPGRPAFAQATGPLLLVGAFAYAMWFFWSLLA